MCVTCGCADNNQTTITNMEYADHHTHTLADGTVLLILITMKNHPKFMLKYIIQPYL